MNSLKQSQIELINLAKKGNQSAMNTLYSLYSKAILNTSYRILNSIEDAEDVLQESFINVFKQLPNLDNKNSFSSWVKRIVINKSIDSLKKKKRLQWQTYNDQSIDNQVKPINYSEENNQHLIQTSIRALQKLPAGYRTVFSLYYLEGFDHSEISEILNIKVSTSISQLSRARNKMRFLIEKDS